MICHYFSEPAYLIFAEGLPALLYYSHIPATILSLLIGLFVFMNGRQHLLNRLLLGISVSFSLWTLFSLITWTNIHSDVILFVWSFFGILYSAISILCIYFISVFLTGKDISAGRKLVLAALSLPVLVLAPLSVNLSGFDLSACDSSGFEGIFYIGYYTFLGVVGMLWILWLLIAHYRKADKDFRRQILLMGAGIELFLFLFFVAGFLTSFLIDAGFLSGYELEQYGLFGMVFFMALLGFMIVQFKTFHVGMMAAQALVVALIILIGSQFAFVQTQTNLVLVSITLVLTGAIGIVLVRSVRREIEQRKHIEMLAKDLEKSNKQQIILIHFITHQIKGFMTKSRNIFSLFLDGDYGPIPETMRPMIEEGFKSDTKGVNTIQEILNAANIKSGRVTYDMTDVDLKAIIDEVSKDLRTTAEAKGLLFKLDVPAEPFVLKADRLQLLNAFKNLIDNSIKYTPKGSVTVSLRKVDGKIRFMIEDTGVGICDEDKERLFTEGGHGVNSQKVNVESTGFGLYIVKNIIEAHHGKVWAESEGEGKGARFIAELPVE